MKRIKYLIILLLLVPTIVLANSDYKVEDYDVDIVIHNDDLQYKESLDLKFYKENVLLTKKMQEDFKNLDSNKNLVIEKSSYNLIKIYSRENEERYEIEYLLNNQKKSNYMYELDIKNNYNNNLYNITFSVKAPRDIAKSKIEFYLEGKNITSLVNYELDNDTLTGNYNKILKENEKITIKIIYGNFYLSNSNFICLSLSIVLSIISYFIWYFYGKDTKIVKVRTQKFAKDFGPLELALVNNERVEFADAYPLIIHLANQGYLNIIEDRKGFTIEKKKDYDGKNYKEALFMKNFFREGISVSLSEYLNIIAEERDDKSKIKQVKSVPDSDLAKHYKRSTNILLPLMNSEDEKNVYFEDRAEKLKYYLILMIAMILIAATSAPFIDSNHLYLLPLSVIFSIAILYVLIQSLRNIDIYKKSNRYLLYGLVGLLIVLSFIIPSFKTNIMYSISFLVSIIASIFILFIYKYMPKRTIYGTKIMGKVEGFKDFILNDRKEEIERVLELNNNYLYDALPYAYILGIEDKVYDLLKEYETPKPDWLTTSHKYSSDTLKRFMYNLKKVLIKKEEVK
jgi:hypothetical protein